MRIGSRAAIGSAMLIVLSACGGGGGNSSGGSARAAMIATQLESCVSSAGSAGPTPAGVDLRAVCGCAIDRVTEGKSDDELRAMFSRAPNADEMAITRTCMMDAVQAAMKK